MTTAQITRIDPVNLRENAYNALHDAFTRGAFAPGDVLTLRDLAEQLGVSMTPVREAVRRLVAQGALIDATARKLMVPPFDERRARDLLATRLVLEALALDQAMDRIAPADIETLRGMLGRDRRDTGPGAGPGAEPGAGPGIDLVTNHAFHFTLYRIGGSAVLLPIVEGLWLQYGAYLNLIINRPGVTEIDEHVHHIDLVTALAAGDRAAAHAALRADITRSFTFLLPSERTP